MPPLVEVAGFTDSVAVGCAVDGGEVDAVEDGSAGGADPSSHKSILFPTRIHDTCGSACSRTSASQFFTFRKPRERGESVSMIHSFRELGTELTLSRSNIIYE